MKNIVLTVIVLLSGYMMNGQEKAARASVIMSEAYAKAEKEDKKVFIMFHASWCGWCKKMDAKMNDPALKAYFDDNFVIEQLVNMEQKQKVYLDTPVAETMFKKYTNNKSIGIPFWLIFNAKGELLEDSFNANNKDKNIGCPQQDHEVKEFVRILKSTTDLDEQAIAKIAEKFSAK